MYLKKINLLGFKTFADKVSLEFSPGITCIVGPNGGGKSNIADSLRFCLGEQSTRNLRALKLEEIIFAGSQKRKMLGLGEVEMILDNSDKTLPVDFSEVNILRRIFREGENQFFINKTQCRLKDIQELLMGTGIGSGALTFLSQNEVDLVLSSSDNRRIIIEEVAGTNKYKFRKKEAIRKLTQTDLNLSRLRDILNEIEGQLSSLASQVRKFKRYSKYKEKLVEAEKSYLLAKLKNLDIDYQPIIDETEKVKAIEEEINNKIINLEDVKDSESKLLWESEELLAKTEEEITNIKLHLQRQNDFKELVKERIENFLQSRDQLAKEIENLSHDQDSFKLKLSEFHAVMENCRIEREDINRQIQDEANREAKIKHDKQPIGSDLSQKYHNILNEIADIKSQANSAAEKHKYVLAETEKLENRSNNITLKIQEHDKTLFKNSASIAKLEESLEANKKILESLESVYLNEWEKLCFLAEKETNINKEIGTLSGGGSFLKNLESVADACAADFKNKTGQTDFNCPLVITCDKDYENVNVAMENLKLNLQNTACEKHSLEESRLKTNNLIKSREKICDNISIKLNSLANFAENFIVKSKEALEKEQNDINIRLNDLKTEASLLENALTNFEKDLIIKEEEHALIKSNFDSQKDLVLKFDEELEVVKNNIQNLMIRCAEIKQKENDLNEKCDIFNKQILSAEEKIKNNHQQIKNYDEKIVQNKERLTEIENEVNLSDIKKEEILKGKEAIAGKVGELSAKYKEILAQINELKTEKESQHEKFYKLEIKKVEYETKYADYKSMLADYSVVFEEINWDDVQIPDFAGAEKQIARLKNFVINFGGVNLAAEDDYKQLKTRSEFLTNQIADLESAKESLFKAIKEYDENSIVKFKEIFNEVALKFQQIFTEVFNGGCAELTLSSPDDILESGVEIKAQPPGKKLQNISLLSGGEKALTSVAFLFALLEVKTTPFVLLDELDAPLDDSNIERIANLIRKYSEVAQFIIITHNRKTMEAADLLYGVTMEEQGVSKILAVRLEEAQKNYSYKSQKEEQTPIASG